MDATAKFVRNTSELPHSGRRQKCDSAVGEMEETQHQQGGNHGRGAKTNHRPQFVVIHTADRPEKEPGC